MTPESQRIALAEFCGWRRLGAVPDYLNDLNAVHEVELRLIEPSVNMGKKYRQKLGVVCDPNCHEEIYGVHATAAQRAEAVLRTIGKWKE